MIGSTLLRVFLGPWGVRLAVSLRLLRPQCLSGDFDSVSRMQQYGALLCLRRDHFKQPWVRNQVKRLLYSEHAVVRGYAAEKLLCAGYGLAEFRGDLFKLLEYERSHPDITPTVAAALGRAAQKRARAMTALVAELMPTVTAAEPLYIRLVQRAIQETLHWATSLDTYPVEVAEQELPPLLAQFSEPQPMNGLMVSWYLSATLPFVLLLISRIATDASRRQWLAQQRDELALTVFQYAPHPRMKILGPVLDRFHTVLRGGGVA